MKKIKRLPDALIQKRFIRKYTKTKLLELLFLDDKTLAQETLDAIMRTCGSKVERMYELDYSTEDIREQKKYEDERSKYADFLEYICKKRGLEIFAESDMKKEKV